MVIDRIGFGIKMGANGLSGEFFLDNGDLNGLSRIVRID